MRRVSINCHFLILYNSLEFKTQTFYKLGTIDEKNDKEDK